VHLVDLKSLADENHRSVEDLSLMRLSVEDHFVLGAIPPE
jgi:hypothetical protein